MHDEDGRDQEDERRENSRAGGNLLSEEPGRDDRGDGRDHEGDALVAEEMRQGDHRRPSGLVLREQAAPTPAEEPRVEELRVDPGGEGHVALGQHASLVDVHGLVRVAAHEREQVRPGHQRQHARDDGYGTEAPGHP